MPQQSKQIFTQITPVRLSAWKCFSLFASGFAYCKPEGRATALAPKQAGEVKSHSVTAAAQARHLLTNFSLCCWGYMPVSITASYS